MKKMIMALVAAMMMSANAMAQDNDQQVRRGRKPMDQKEMIQRRTDETVKAYGLNDEQAAKLLDLNTRYADKMRPMPRGGQGRFGNRGGGFHRQDMRNAPMPDMKKDVQKPEMEKDAPKPELEEAPKPEMGKDAPRQFSPEDAKARGEEMRKVMEAYNEELKAIMTPEQYEKYQAESKNRFQNGQRGRRGDFRMHQRDNGNNN